MAADPHPVPHSVEELWADFDPRRDPLEVEVIREWRSDGMVFRNVRFLIGTFKGTPARMAAIYGFPEGLKSRVPAVMDIHGGGGRASLGEVKRLVARGYAVLAVNWGGAKGQQAAINEMETAQPGDPNTDWGAVDPTQLNQGRMFSMLPGPKQLFEDREHPKNCNWYLLTIGCRRGLTFLEQQPEVNPERLGVEGYSMGGNLTMYVAGTDRRVKAAVPAVGGSGWRWEEHEFLGGRDRADGVAGDVSVFHQTLGFESYAPLIGCPVLHRSATNDFHGWMDDVYRTNALIKGQPVRYSWSVHLNHALLPEVGVTMPLWFDHFLKDGPPLPETPSSALELKSDDGVPRLVVSPKSRLPVARCEVHYSVDPDPRGRFWRSAECERKGEKFVAKLADIPGGLPLFAFANVYYTLPKPESVDLANVVQREQSIREVCLSSDLHKATAEDLRKAGVAMAQSVSRVIDDCRTEGRDWLNRPREGRSYPWQNWTRKVADPRWRGPDGAQMSVTLKLEETNRISFVVIENERRRYRGAMKTYVCEKEVTGSKDPQTVLLSVADFKEAADGASLRSWGELDQFGCVESRFYAVKGRAPAQEIPAWKGPAPEFQRFEWK